MKQLIFAILLLVPSCLFANTDYKYIDIKQGQIHLGTYKGVFSVKANKVNYNLGQVDPGELDSYLNIKQGDRVLLYFHSLYGGVNVYHKHTIKKLKEIDGFDKVISVIWHTEGLNYLTSWDKASETSLLYQPILSRILERSDIEKSILCHSMGHRIFEGLAKDYLPGDIHINAIAFTGADLGTNVFENSLVHLTGITHKLVLYVHENDRLLKHSKKLHQIGRLGLNGLEPLHQLAEISNLERVDVTNSSGGKLIRLSNHIYFKRDNMVLKDLNAVFNNDPERKAYLTRMEDGVLKML